MPISRPFTTVCLCTILLAAGSAPAGAQVDTNDFHKEWREPVEGTWKCQIDQINQGGSFNAFMSFAAGGVVVATGSLDKVNPVSPVFGSWKQTGRNRVDATIYFYLFDPTGNPMGTLKTNETFRLDDQNKIAGRGMSFLCDVAGENCGDASMGEIKIAGTRIVAEGMKDR